MTCPAKFWLKKIERFLIVFALLVGIPAYSCASSPTKQAGNATELASQTDSVPDPLAYYHFVLGYEYNLANAVDAALDEYAKALSYDPSSVTIQLRLGALYHSRGEHGKAQAHVETVLVQDPSNLTALQLMAAIAVGLNQPDRAIQFYDRIMARYPEDGEAYFSEGMLLAGLKQYEDAEKVVRRGIAITPTSPVG